MNLWEIIQSFPSQALPTLGGAKKEQGMHFCYSRSRYFHHLSVSENHSFPKQDSPPSSSLEDVPLSLDFWRPTIISSECFDSKQWKLRYDVSCFLAYNFFKQNHDTNLFSAKEAWSLPDILRQRWGKKEMLREKCKSLCQKLSYLASLGRDRFGQSEFCTSKC